MHLYHVQLHSLEFETAALIFHMPHGSIEQE